MTRLKRFYNDFIMVIQRPEMLILPGQLAFFFILSVVPILTLISYFATYLNLNFSIFSEFMTRIFGDELSTLLIPEVTNVSLSFGFLFTLITGFFISSGGASSIIVSSNTIYGIKDKGYIQRKIKAIIMTIFLVILFIFILLVPLFGEKILDFILSLNTKASTITNIKLVITLLRGPISWLIIFIFIKLLYTMAPDKKIPSSATTYGALFTTFFWILATAIYSYYINNYAHYSIFYGGLANIIILMLWFYLLAIIFVIGLALNYRRDIEIKNKETSKLDSKNNDK